MNSWCALRGARKVALAETFGEFATSVPVEFLAVLDVTGERDCTFLAIGQKISVLYGNCKAGTMVKDIVPLTARLIISRSFNEVIVSRAPTARRSNYRVLDAAAFYEQLILPFVDNHYNVRRLAVIADGYVLQKKAA
jgi:hypothetical protein